MIVCSCNALSDRAIREAVSGVDRATVSKVYRLLDCAPMCGRCAPTIRDLIRETPGRSGEVDDETDA